jgi:hypothetical protein
MTHVSLLDEKAHLQGTEEACTGKMSSATLKVSGKPETLSDSCHTYIPMADEIQRNIFWFSLVSLKFIPNCTKIANMLFSLRAAFLVSVSVVAGMGRAVRLDKIGVSGVLRDAGVAGIVSAGRSSGYRGSAQVCVVCETSSLCLHSICPR